MSNGKRKIHIILLTAVLLMIIGGPLGSEESTSITLPGCKLRFFLPIRYADVKLGDTQVISSGSLQIDEKKQISVLFSGGCTVNQKRTTMVDEIGENRNDNGSPISGYEKIVLDQNIPSAFYYVDHMLDGRIIEGAAIYFADRNLVYRFYLLPDQKSPGVSRVRIENRQSAPMIHGMTGTQKVLLKKELISILENARFLGPVQKTISESAFRLRLYLVSIVGVLLILGGVLIVVRRWR